MAALSKTASRQTPEMIVEVFWGGLASGYDSGPGKNTRLYNKSNQSSQFKS